ncbi:MAG TPA: hypothetical protein VFK31_11995 [Rhodanobacteraceae bacterium]|nr:hypothetical protein [Rhodanobacteraceae bacterium]
MNRSPRWMSLLSLLLVLGAVMALAGCGPNVKSQAISKAKAAGDFDMTLQAYKSGQFLLNGAILSSLDLSSHFAYLRDQHDLPKTVLLERSDKSSIHKEHLGYMASMAYNYGFVVYYDDDGELRRIVPTVDNKNIKLRDSPKSDQQGHPHVESHDAAHDGTRPDYGY